MLSQKLRLSRRRIGVPPLDRLRDPRVKLLPAALEQAVVRGVLNQRMLESVDGLRRTAASEDQSGGFELRQRLK
jgi:hypothetical protein